MQRSILRPDLLHWKIYSMQKTSESCSFEALLFSLAASTAKVTLLLSFDRFTCRLLIWSATSTRFMGRSVPILHTGHITKEMTQAINMNSTCYVNPALLVRLSHEWNAEWESRLEIDLNRFIFLLLLVREFALWTRVAAPPSLLCSITLAHVKKYQRRCCGSCSADLDPAPFMAFLRWLIKGWLTKPQLLFYRPSMSAVRGLKVLPRYNCCSRFNLSAEVRDEERLCGHINENKASEELSSTKSRQ